MDAIRERALETAARLVAGGLVLPSDLLPTADAIAVWLRGSVPAVAPVSADTEARALAGDLAGWLFDAGHGTVVVDAVGGSAVGFKPISGRFDLVAVARRLLAWSAARG